MIAEARNVVTEPGAQRREGATTAPPASLGTIGGIPVEKIIEDMRNANMGEANIYRYLSHAGVGSIAGMRGSKANGTT